MAEHGFYVSVLINVCNSRNDIKNLTKTVNDIVKLIKAYAQIWGFLSCVTLHIMVKL